eukprot:m.506939 g.506939  ORF g.506939 m.506939 type:complete len:507 (+) comp21877_c2_seq5:255-1775(+)
MNVFTVVKRCSCRVWLTRPFRRKVQNFRNLWRVEIEETCVPLSQRKYLNIKCAERSHPKVLVLAGPTAIGKSAVGLKIAEILDGEIISADSAQVYHDLNIGTAKPCEDTQQQIPHHLIDISPTDKQFTTGDFVRLATRAIEKIVEKGKTPIIVGGSAFYLRNLIEGLPGTPPNDAKVELQVEESLAGMEWTDALNVLKKKDAKYASKLSTNDWKRLKRALNIIEISGRPVSSFSASKDDKDASKQFDFRCVFLTSTRLDLYSRIDERCEQMVRNGFIEEVIRLQHNGQLERWMPAAQALGYRQALDFLDNEWFTSLTRSKQRRRRALLRFIAIFQAATRNYARKQIAWFRNHEDRFVWMYRDFEMDDDFDGEEGAFDDEAIIAQRIVEHYQASWEEPTPEAVAERRRLDIRSVKDAQMGRYEAVPVIFDDVEEVDAVVHSIRATLAPLYTELGLADEIADELAIEEEKHVVRARGRQRLVDVRERARPRTVSAARRARRRERKQLY